MPKNENYIIGIDIGTTKICCVIAEIKENSLLEVIGVGTVPSRGMRKGVVVNLDETIKAIKNAVEEAELMSGFAVEKAYVGIAGSHIKSFNSRGVVAISGKDKMVTKDDIKRVIEHAETVTIPQEREIIHVLPQEYIVDDMGGIEDPLSLNGSRLEVNVHIVTALISSIQNLMSSVNGAGIEVIDIILEQFAASEAILIPDEKELGVALIDIGGGTSNLSIYEKGAAWHTSVFPLGGDNFTNDIAVGLHTSIPDAEKIKKKYGCALSTLLEEDQPLEVPAIGNNKPTMVSQQVLCGIIQPRAEEIFQIVHDEIKRTGFENYLNAGVVLSGGGCIMQGMTDVAEQVLGMPVRRGVPMNIGGLIDVVNSPAYSTAIGLVLYGWKFGTKRRTEQPSVITKTIKKLQEAFRGMF
ncbi:MAG: cell division protein FtsA [Acidobacteriota bacterium]